MTVSQTDISLIGNLQYDKAYLLLLDYIQSVLDGDMELFADARLPDEESLRALKHWRALRDVHQILKNQPQYFAQQVSTSPQLVDKDEDMLIRTNTGYQIPPLPVLYR